MTKTIETQTQAQNPMTTIRAAFPVLRRAQAVAIVHSGGKATALGCLCGAVHTCATSSRDKTRHVQAFRAAHKDCAQDLAERVAQAKLVSRTHRAGHLVFESLTLV